MLKAPHLSVGCEMHFLYIHIIRIFL